MDIEEALGEVEPQETTEETSEETKEVETKAEEAEEPETPPVSEKMVPESALVGLRKDLKGQIKDLEARIKEQPEPEPEPVTSIFDSEEGHVSDMDKRWNDRMTRQLLATGRTFAIRQYGDKEKVDTAFSWADDAISKSPTIARQFENIPAAEFHFKAVELYEQEQARTKQDDPVTDRALIREEVRLELKEEAEKKAKEKEALHDSIPETLVGDTSQGGLSGSDWEGPATIESIID